VIDIGAGTGAMLEVLSERGFAQEYAATDISELAVSFMNEHPFPGFVGAIKASADNLPYEDQSFDLAILSHVLEHVPDPAIALEEASRVAVRVCVELPIELALLPKSKAILTNLSRGRVPINPIGHLHFFSVRGVRDLVRTAGLRIETEFRYRTGLQWLRMHYGKGSMNCWIREKLGSIFPIWLYGFFLSTNFVVLCSRPQSQGHKAQA
jgi:ubiquinone/menaquinone biosynthesis C-methylase UbiE